MVVPSLVGELVLMPESTGFKSLTSVLPCWDADFLGHFRFKPAVVTTVEGMQKGCFRVLDQWENIGFWCEFC